jgi:Transposase
MCSQSTGPERTKNARVRSGARQNSKNRWHKHYFCARKEFSSGVIEGLNNKAKVTMRKAYGYRTFRIAEVSLFHVLGKLPEPKLAHNFY